LIALFYDRLDVLEAEGEGQLFPDVATALLFGVFASSASSVRETEKPCFQGLSVGGAYRDRTGDLRLAKPALSQLS
jgi:hypothetical protein